MGLQVIIAIGSCATALGLTVRSVLAFLDRREDRRLARYMFDQTRSTDGLRGYIELRKAQHPIGPLSRRPEGANVPDQLPPISDGRGAA